MNVKKIIKGIIGLGAIGGVAYAAYKLGESDGRFNEIHRRMTENGDEDDEDIEVEEDDDYRFYDNSSDLFYQTIRIQDSNFGIIIYIK